MQRGKANNKFLFIKVTDLMFELIFGVACYAR